ncbi:MAG TPA: AraC family transcriptional regulator [Longimicrobiales bacterium]|nr:AraC family transcriptional regulator [Longimicrobiales bacterium]
MVWWRIVAVLARLGTRAKALKPSPSMIVARLTDPLLLKAVRAAAHVEEDVVAESRLVENALQSGFPRLLVRANGFVDDRPPPGVPVLDLDRALLKRWESERWQEGLPVAKLDHLTGRLSALMERSAEDRTWVDAALADLSRAAGARLPLPLRAFGRRILEFPSRYTTLYPVARSCGLSRGALKARFRRRGLESPYTYLRWFRIMAVSHVLSDRSVTVAAAAHRLGFTSDGNLCRMIGVTSRLTPTDVRSVRGWNTLLISFAWAHLTQDALDAWAAMDGLFERRVA